MSCQFLLYNKVNQPYIYIYPHLSSLLHLPSTLLFPPLSVITKHPADLPVLCGSFHYLLILHLVVYIGPCHSLTSSQLTLPPPRFLKSIIYVCVFIPNLPLGSSEPYSCFFIFLGSKHMCQHIVFVFLFLTYFSLHDRFQVHEPHYK